jgi:peptidoglycan hydrolase CwlO-like protein
LEEEKEEVMDFMALYGEAGMIGVVGAMFVYLVVSLSNKSAQQQETLENLKTENRGQSETLENMEGMIIKLIERWNKSDDKLDRKFDAMTKEINDLDNQISRVEGSLSRINGKH